NTAPANIHWYPSSTPTAAYGTDIAKQHRDNSMRLINQDRQRRILGLSKRLNELAAARRELLLQLADLDARASATQLEHNSLYNLDAPVSTVPDEVLAAIFEAGMDRRDVSYHFGVLVSHVTQRWRNVSVGTPKLWSNIWCIAPYDESPYPEKLIDRASTFLSRARALPLDLTFKDFYDVNFSSSFLRLISDHIGHCRQLRIVDGNNEGLMRVLKCVPSQPMPFLVLIDLGFHMTYIEFQEQLFPSGCHRLATARIVNVEMHTMHFCLPAFESLTALQLTGIYIESGNDDVEYGPFRDALMALPSLRHLELNVDNFDPLSSHGRLPILLPKLKHLHVEVRGTSNLDDILCCIHAASLVALSLLTRDNDGEPVALDADTFDFPTLQRLVLTNAADTVPDLATLVAFARNFPRIEHLTFEPGMGADPSLHDINRILCSILCGADDNDGAENNAHIGPLWPKLQSFAFSTSNKDFDAPKLKGTISSCELRTILFANFCCPAGLPSGKCKFKGRSYGQLVAECCERPTSPPVSGRAGQSGALVRRTVTQMRHSSATVIWQLARADNLFGTALILLLLVSRK
ncbi:hypothetical protein FIBSPDRAFT_848723, partial [Athelia psychrophila]